MDHADTVQRMAEVRCLVGLLSDQYFMENDLFLAQAGA